MADNSGENNTGGVPSDYLQSNNTGGGYNQSGINGNNNDFSTEDNINYDNYSMRQDLENNIKREQERELHQSLMGLSNNSLMTSISSEKPLTSQEAAHMYTPTHPDYGQIGSLEFDGQNLIWLQNGQPVKYYPAVSGRADYQSAQYTNERKRGPIPEGDYLLGQGTGEDYNNKEEMSFWNEYIRGRSPWYKDPFAWGKSRIPIQPLPTTNTFGRDRMYVHGGNVPGSAGCIDLTYRNDDFYNDFKNYNGNLSLKVKYPKGW